MEFKSAGQLASDVKYCKIYGATKEQSMATMIPKTINTSNYTELQVFKRLRDETPNDWVVFHSLHVLQKDRGAPEEDSPYARELDFVILMRSVVLYLEVKGGRCYEVKCRQWYNRRGEKVKDPVEQARSGAFALMNDARESIKMSHLKFRYGVLLTNTHWPCDDPRSPNKKMIIPPRDDKEEWIENNVPRRPPGCLLIDGDVYLRGDDSGLRNALIHYAYKTGLTKKERRQLENPTYLSELERQRNDLQKFLAPSFSLRFVKVNRNVLQRANSELLELTEQQYSVLRLTEHNERVMIDGAAGTGKTLLAVELARRRHDKGNRVVLFCAIPSMANWLRQLGVPDEVEIAPFRQPSHLIKLLLGEDLSPRTLPLWLRSIEIDREYEDAYATSVEASMAYEEGFQRRWEAFEDARSALMEEVVSEFLREGREPPFDYVIVDEAQILASADSLKMVDAVLVGGISSGNWTMFGDFSNQNILFDTRKKDLRQEFRESYLQVWTEDKLSINCRNTQPIAEVVSEFAAPYSYDVDDVFQIPGPAARRIYYKDDDPLSKTWDLLDSEIGALQKQAVRNEQIVVLHNVKLDDDRRYGINGLEINDISEDYTLLSKSHLNACNIVSFQGFESDVIILVPGVTEDKEDERRTLYTAMSRAKGHLIVIANEELRPLFEGVQ